MKSKTAPPSLIAFFSIVALLVIYVTINTGGTWQFKEIRGFLRYDFLADAFLSGQLFLKIPPDPGRLRAVDPRDPAVPRPFIVDAIIWEGKHYFTQDPVPGLVHALFILLFGFPCRTGLMVIVFSTGFLVWLWLILRTVQKSYAPDQEWTLWLTWLCFALSGSQLYMVSKPVVYHEAIAAGMFFIASGTYCFLWQTLRQKHFAWLGVAALLWGLGVASRITLVFYPLVLVTCGLYLAIKRRESYARLASCAAFLIVPLAITLFLLLLHNYYRFGNFLDFGRTHITVPGRHFYFYLTIMDNSFRLVHVPFNLYHYFVTLPEFSPEWPYVIHPFYDIAYATDIVMSRENVSSLLFIMPVLLLAAPHREVIRWLREDPVLASAIIAFVAASFATFLLLLCYYRAVSRYLYEFTPLLFPLILCNIAVRWKKSAGSRGWSTRKVMIVVVVILNVFGGVFLGLNGMMQ